MQLELFDEVPKPGFESAETFQARSSAQGRLVQQIAWDVLQQAGFDLVQERYRLRVLGVEVNMVVRDAHGSRWFCEVTGAYGSQRPGLERTDTVRKIAGSAQLLARWRFTPFLVLTTHRPKVGSQAYQMLKACGPEAIYDVIVVSEKEDWARLQRYAKEGVAAGPLPGWWQRGELQALARPPYEAKSSGLPAIPDDTATLMDLIDQPEGRSTKLLHWLKLFVPSKDSAGKTIDRVVRAQFVQDFLVWCSTRNGGLFQQSAEGSWLDARGNVIDEAVLAVESWGATKVMDSELQPFINRMFSELDQESVCFIVDNEMQLRSRSPATKPSERVFVERSEALVEELVERE